MNTFLNGLSNETNISVTENGAIAHKTTNSAVYDMFALGGAYRNRTPLDVISLFSRALSEDTELALRCLFYLRDVRGGAGERRFFRIAMDSLLETNPDMVVKLLPLISEYGRWDDLIYLAHFNTTNYSSFSKSNITRTIGDIIKNQLSMDLTTKTPSLLAKWMPSENASSKYTKEIATAIRKNVLNQTHKEYRRMLSYLRERINIVERLMSAGEWDKIEFDKLPSQAGLKYKSAFAKRKEIADKYAEFIHSKTTTVNAGVLAPYEIIHKIRNQWDWCNFRGTSEERAAYDKYWKNLPDYLNGKPCKLMCVVDTSASMTCGGSGAATPIDVATSLGIYCAERIGGPFKNHYISFSRKPQLVKVLDSDIVTKAIEIIRTDLCDDTNLEAVFDLLLKIAQNPDTKEEDMPEKLVIISDMQINCLCSGDMRWGNEENAKNTVVQTMDAIRQRWDVAGIKMPDLIFWNVNASRDTILDLSPRVSYVSGVSPILFESILSGKTGYDLMLEKLMSKRYDLVSNCIN